MTNYPTYQSPIRTFQELGISADNIDSNKLKFERKRLLLEIQISSSQSTMIGDKELSKNDVIELFDELDRITHLDYHKAIFNHPKLLNLLEKSEVVGKVEDKHKIRFSSQEEWDDFIDFVSPYLAESIDKLLSKVIRKSNFKQLDEIRNFFKLLTTRDSFYAFRKFNNFCETLSDRLDHIARNNIQYPSKEVTFLRFPAFYNVANELTNIYPILPNSVAHAVINFTVDCQRKIGRGKELIEISDQARRLHCDAKSKTLIVNNRDSFYESREQNLGYNPNRIWRAIVGIVFIFFILFRVVNRCESSRNNSTINPQQKELMDRIREIRNNQTINKEYTPIRRSGTSDFDESSFLDFHEQMIESTEAGNYKEILNITPGEPGIISPFKADSGDPIYNLKNETKSDMVMIVSAGSGLTSYFVAANKSILFSAGENAGIFFYSGRIWKDDRTIEHIHRSPLTNQTHMIRFNGHFLARFNKDREFLKKYFSLTDGVSEDFTISEVESKYEFFQGGRYVNYSF